MKFKGRVAHKAKAGKQGEQWFEEHKYYDNCKDAEFRKYLHCLFLFLSLSVFDGYIIIIFYKNASGDRSASPNAEAVKLSEEL